MNNWQKRAKTGWIKRSSNCTFIECVCPLCVYVCVCVVQRSVFSAYGQPFQM